MFIRSLILVCLVVFVANTVDAQKYIGAAKCKMCHNSATKGAQYKVWSEKAHSKAWDLLSDEEKKKPECAKCHSTFHSVDASLRGTITEAEGVSCESCHGPASLYKTLHMKKGNQAAAIEAGLIIPEEKVCLQCHNDESEHFNGFDYAVEVAKITHPRP